MKLHKSCSAQTLPLTEDLTRFAPFYAPEKFTPEEKEYLTPFFSNLDKPIFVISHLPEEVIGALSSRYSRSKQSLRRLFLKEYVGPIAHPELQKNWNELSEKEKDETLKVKEKFKNLIEFLNREGGIEYVVNIQRGRKFFDTWLAQYGDDSISELGGAHVGLEGVSLVATKEIQDKRVGLSPLEKSTRYVSFADQQLNGEYLYYVPGEIRALPLEKEYKKVMNALFETYIEIGEPYVEYIKKRYPQGEDETPNSFQNSRSAKRFDDTRDLLPFSTVTSFALYGNGRAYEDLINRLAAHPLGELRWWGQALHRELSKVVPSFVGRAATSRGAQMQQYRQNLNIIRREIASSILKNSKPGFKPARWVKLINYTPNAEAEVLSAFIFAESAGLTLAEIRKTISNMGTKARKDYLTQILQERMLGDSQAPRHIARFKKAPRAWENAHFTFEIWARGGDYRDLHRHRQMTQERQLFTTRWGYDLEREVMESQFLTRFQKVFEEAEKLYEKLLKVSPEAAQYAVPLGYLQHWYIKITAREIYWMVELRTGPQGRPHYRQICQQIAQLARDAVPGLFTHLMVDMNDYAISRRESEKKIEKKLANLEKK